MSFQYVEGRPSFISEDRIVSFQKSSDLRANPLVFDIPTTAAYYNKDQDMDLGELGFFGQRSQQNKNFTIDILQDRKVIETPTGKFKYKVPFYTSQECRTTRDSSQGNTPLGIDGTPFKLYFSEEFKPGDVLGADPQNSQQVYVSFEDQVLQKGDGYEHIVYLLTKDSKESYKRQHLMAGVKYYKISNILGGERDTYLSGVRVPNSVPGFIECEFEIGNGSGVEMEVSAVANETRLATSFKNGFIDELNMDMATFAETWGDVAIIMDRDANGNAKLESKRLANVAEWLTKREHLNIINNRAMYQRKGTVATTSGHVNIAEGLWHQFKRGKVDTYSRKNGITREHLKNMSNYIFKGTSIPVHERRLVLDCGYFAELNIREMFQEEFNSQMGRLSNITGLFGTDGQIPKSPISGPLNDLKIETVRVGEVLLPGIGYVRLNHNPALDYMGNLSGDQNNGSYSNSAWSVVVWDARNQKFSNNKYVPQGVEYVEGAPQDSNVYLVKYPGALIHTGRVNGAYDPFKSSDVISSGNKQRFASFYSWDMGASYFLVDPSAFCMLELDASDKRGYN